MSSISAKALLLIYCQEIGTCMVIDTINTQVRLFTETSHVWKRREQEKESGDFIPYHKLWLTKVIKLTA